MRQWKYIYVLILQADKQIPWNNVEMKGNKTKQILQQI